ncbi:helix-turn-helix domain-containing protein [Priestia megaterium]|uniref:hypothetical protein n=1 Tax=Priestia megaterium TaxID=1404 RepID=UPI0027959ADB|nr:hypothetical protein [Priestia megaterium]
MTREVSFQEAQKPRNELLLSISYYIVADDWLDKLGDRAYTTWLRFITWCDRTDKNRTEDKIPQSLEKVAERLGISKPTLYNKIIIPLWEHGLIDLVEYKESNRKSTKPLNIIVYPYPQNQKKLETEPLEKCRDWKRDYSSEAKTFASMRGKEKVEKKSDENKSSLKQGKHYKIARKNNFTVEGKNNFTVEGKKHFTVTVKNNLPNNVSNISTNLSNSSNNVSNMFYKDDDDKELNEFQINHFAFNEFVQHFKEQYPSLLDDRMFQNIYIQMERYELDFFTIKEAERQVKRMKNYGLEKISDYATYFVGGIIKNRTSKKGVVAERKIDKAQKELERIKQQKQEQKVANSTIPFFNWLEN